MYVCMHKSMDACKCLKKHGHVAHVVCGLITELDEYHAWVELEKDGEIYWYDPTWAIYDPKYGCWKTKLWVDRMVRQPKGVGKIKYSTTKGEH